MTTKSHFIAYLFAGLLLLMTQNALAGVSGVGYNWQFQISGSEAASSIYDTVSRTCSWAANAASAVFGGCWRHKRKVLRTAFYATSLFAAVDLYGISNVAQFIPSFLLLAHFSGNKQLAHIFATTLQLGLVSAGRDVTQMGYRNIGEYRQKNPLFTLLSNTTHSSHNLIHGSYGRNELHDRYEAPKYWELAPGITLNATQSEQLIYVNSAVANIALEIAVPPSNSLALISDIGNSIGAIAGINAGYFCAHKNYCPKTHCAPLNSSYVRDTCPVSGECQPTSCINPLTYFVHDHVTYETVPLINKNGVPFTDPRDTGGFAIFNNGTIDIIKKPAGGWDLLLPNIRSLVTAGPLLKFEGVPLNKMAYLNNPLWFQDTQLSPRSHLIKYCNGDWGFYRNTTPYMGRQKHPLVPPSPRKGGIDLITGIELWESNSAVCTVLNLDGGKASLMWAMGVNDPARWVDIPNVRETAQHIANGIFILPR